MDAYLDVGWFWDGKNFECHHGDYAVIMEWLCDCPVREPKK